MNQKTYIFGAGSIGGFFAAYLIRRYGPQRIEVIEKNHNLAERINAAGFRVKTSSETFHTYIKVTPLEEFKQDETGFYIIAAKQYDTISALKKIPAENRGILFLQNGYNHETMRQFNGQASFGVLGVTHNKIAPNFIHQITSGNIYIGNPSRCSTPEEEETAEFFRIAGIPAETADNFWPIFWSKLCRNASSNPLTALSGKTLGELLADKKTARAVVNIYEETSNIARCELQKRGYTAKICGMNNVSSGEFERFKALAFKPIIGKIAREIAKSRLKEVRTSMSDDIERGLPTEISYINGFVCETAEKIGIEPKYNQRIVELVHALEKKEISRTTANLEELAA